MEKELGERKLQKNRKKEKSDLLVDKSLSAEEKERPLSVVLVSTKSRVWQQVVTIKLAQL